MKKQTQGIILSVVLFLIIALILFNWNTLRAMVRGEGVVGGSDVLALREFLMDKEATDTMESINATEEMMLYTGAGKLTAKNYEDKVLWSQALDTNSILLVNNDKILAVEKPTGNTYLFGMDGRLIASAIGLGEINRAEYLDNGKVMLYLGDEKQMLLLMPDLQTEAHMVIPTGTIINSHINVAQNRMSVLVLEDESGVLNTSVLIYDLNGKVIKVINLEGLALNAITYKEGIFVVYPNRIAVYDEKFLKPLEWFDFKRISFAQPSDELMLLQTGSKDPVQGQGELELTAFSLDTKKITFNTKIPDEYDKIVAGDNLVVLYTKNVLQIYNKSGKLYVSKSYPDPVRRVILLPDDRLLIIFPNKMTINKLEI